MPNFICVQCGTQHEQSPEPPLSCAICDDERQYVRWSGQEWTTLESIAKTFTSRIEQDGPAITGIGASPTLAIGQRALLLESATGNVLWDCVAILTPEIQRAVMARGGLSAIAISHPHYYTAMVEWSDAFGGVPIYLHADDAVWVQRQSPHIRYWSGETHAIGGDMTLIRCGGHFDGGTVLHWSKALEGKGAVFAGDILQVTQDRQHVSFMYSFPNYIPLGPAAIARIEAAMRPWNYDAVFGAWWKQNILTDGKEAVSRSIDRYLSAIR